MSGFTEKYLEILKSDYQGLNLTRILSPEEFELKQYRDSLIPYEESAVFKKSLEDCGRMVDVGFGGGFPILPMAYNYQSLKFVGLEARKKKSLAVNDIAHKMSLENVKTYHHRLESVLIDMPVVITLKAVGKINEMLSLIQSTAGVKVFFYKGPNVHEIENWSSSLEKWKLIEDLRLDIPGTEGRVLLGFELKNKNVPRGTKSNKSLVKVSQLF
jgi:16S rRNA (guanine527-N7)-methyltransferase